MIETDLPARFAGHYTFTRDDYLAMVHALDQPQQGVRTILVTAWISLFVLVIGLMSKNWPEFLQAMRDLVTFNEVPFFIYGLLLAGFVLIALLPNLTLLRAMRLYSGLAIADQQIDVVIDEAGLTTSVPGRHGQLEWSIFRRVVVKPEHLFLTISRREALLLPRRAFATAAEFEAVTALAQRKVPSVPLK
jgi:YcxB-like protein